MKKNILYSLFSILVGIGFTVAVVYTYAPQIMILEDESKYDFTQTVQKFEASAKGSCHIIKGQEKSNCWKIPVQHDLKKTMEKHGKSVLNIKVFELCQPELAYKIISRDKERSVASLMPCRVAIYERSDGKVYISRLNTSLFAKMMGGVIPEVMEQATQETEAMLSGIIQLP